MTSSAGVQRISECFIKPLHPIEDSKQICNLTKWDISMLSFHYIQKGLLFKKPPSNTQQDFINNLLEKLKHSLSLTLNHFYPLSGHLVTNKTENPPSYTIHIDCNNNNSQGAKFIYATLNLTISDILSPIYVPPIVGSLFDLDRAINHDGHTLPFLSIQVTELIDGVFIGCSMNHSIGDGTSYWNFFNTWSHIFQTPHIPILPPPFHTRWFPESSSPPINLPFKHHEEFTSRYESPNLRERYFHFSKESIEKLRAKANMETSNTTRLISISSFQSLSAHVWRCMTRARGLPRDQKTSCLLAINDRVRMEPKLPQEYFGNSVDVLSTEMTAAGELLDNNLGWAAWKVHVAVTNHDDKKVRELVKKWLEDPVVYQIGVHFDPFCVTMSSSPRFNMYGNEFGMGKAVTVLSGYANKIDGNVTAYEGYDGGGSIDLAVNLSPDAMSKLELDEEFMSVVSVPNPSY